ncbi:MAG: DUF1259 domain-containing protein [Pseudomonadota bacterium]|nr:DUF1259 domain-containing protein [Pseudomonadota bacterium]
MIRTIAVAAALALPLICSPSAGARPLQDHWKLVDEGLGRGGTTQPDGVRRYSFPRSDLNVQLDGVTIRPALALGSWLAFQKVGDRTMVMGDLVLTHEEVNPVMTELLERGITVTALHNHLLRSSPATMYMHVKGHGDPWELAVALRTALAESRTPMQSAPPAAEARLDLDTGALDRILGRQAKANGGVYQFVIARPERLTDHGAPAPETMGTGTVLNFQPLGGGRAAVTGDFVLLDSEVNPVMRALRAANIEVTALHNHMLDDQPRLFFMHFWAVGNSAQLATTLRAALDRTNVTRH